MKGASGGMEQVLKRIENLLTVKSIVTLALTAVFAWQAVKGEVSQDFMMIYTTVIAFYFGKQFLEEYKLQNERKSALDIKREERKQEAQQPA